MTDPGAGQGYSRGLGGAFSFQDGVWLSKAEGARCEKYHRWADDHVKSEVHKLDKQQHTNLVKLNGQCLEVRRELRGLQQDRRRLTRSQGSAESTDSVDSLASASLAGSTASSTNKGLWKSPSSASLTSSSSGYSSLGSPVSTGRRSVGMVDNERNWDGLRMKGMGIAIKSLSPGVSASRLKNLHSARTLSKLKNNMNIDD